MRSNNDIDISHVFNVEDLLPYRGTFEPSTLPYTMYAGDDGKNLCRYAI